MLKGFFKMSPSVAALSSSSRAPAPRHLVSMLEVSNAELGDLVARAQQFKQQVRLGAVAPPEHHRKLAGKLVALLFSKRSTRTRILTEGAAAYFGAQPLFLGKDDIQLGVNETFYDLTRVISLMTSCIFARVDLHLQIEELCRHLSVPIINLLCDRFHPLQAIADILTIKELFGRTQGLKLAWIGDANNVINDLAVAALRSGMSVSVAVPQGIEFDREVLQFARKLAADSKLTFEVVHDPLEALANANVVVTDTWISMGEELQKQAKLEQFKGYQIDRKMVSKGGVASEWVFMHCLPRHQEEVADDVFYSPESRVFEEAENRLYAAMAVIDTLVVK